MATSSASRTRPSPSHWKISDPLETNARVGVSKVRGHPWNRLKEGRGWDRTGCESIEMISMEGHAIEMISLEGGVGCAPT